MRNFYPCLVLLCGIALPAHAQEGHGVKPDSIALRNDCRLARQVLVQGQPANKREWALGIIVNCGSAGADAIADQFRAVRALQVRTPALDAIANAAVMVIDEQLYTMARTVASDPSAGEAARVYAMGIWLAQVSGGDILPYEALISDPTAGGPLVLGTMVSARPLTLRPLPSDALASSMAALSEILGNEANSCVQIAARQVLSALELLIAESNS